MASTKLRSAIRVDEGEKNAQDPDTSVCIDSAMRQPDSSLCCYWHRCIHWLTVAGGGCQCCNARCSCNTKHNVLVESVEQPTTLMLEFCDCSIDKNTGASRTWRRLSTNHQYVQHRRHLLCACDNNTYDICVRVYRMLSKTKLRNYVYKQRRVGQAVVCTNCAPSSRCSQQHRSNEQQAVLQSLVRIHSPILNCILAIAKARPRPPYTRQTILGLDWIGLAWIGLQLKCFTYFIYH
jgi:hypothetical protein